MKNRTSSLPSGEGECEAPGWGRRPDSQVPVEVARALRRRMTRHEARLWTKLRLLRAAGHHFRRQVPIGAFVVDFACLRARVVVELDGGQHSHDLAARRDAERDRRMAALGFRVLRFWNGEVDGDLGAVLDTIVAALSPAGDPAPVRAARDSALP